MIFIPHCSLAITKTTDYELPVWPYANMENFCLELKVLWHIGKHLWVWLDKSSYCLFNKEDKPFFHRACWLWNVHLDVCLHLQDMSSSQIVSSMLLCWEVFVTLFLCLNQGPFSDAGK